MPKKPVVRNSRFATLTAVVQRAHASMAESKLEARSLIEEVRKRMGAIAAGFYDVGEALAKLREKRLYAALGHQSFDALLEAIGFSKAQAYRFIGVAQRMSRARAIQLGPRRAVALLRLASATAPDDTVEDLLKRGVTMPGQKAPLRVESLSADQIEDAARTVARGHLPQKSRLPAAESEAAHDYAAQIRSRLESIAAHGARVSVHRRSRGSDREVLMLRFEVPYESRDALRSALMTGKRG